MSQIEAGASRVPCQCNQECRFGYRFVRPTRRARRTWCPGRSYGRRDGNTPCPSMRTLTGLKIFSARHSAGGSTNHPSAPSPRDDPPTRPLAGMKSILDQSDAETRGNAPCPVGEMNIDESLVLPYNTTPMAPGGDRTVSCKLCDGFCRRSPRHGLWDFIVGWLGWYPWRCQQCRSRNYIRRRL